MRAISNEIKISLNLSQCEILFISMKMITIFGSEQVSHLFLWFSDELSWLWELEINYIEFFSDINQAW